MGDSVFMYLVDSKYIQPSLLLFIKMNQKLILFGSVIVVAFGAFIGVAIDLQMQSLITIFSES